MDVAGLKAALLSAYSVDSFGQMLTLAMGDELEDITTANGFEAQVLDTIRHYMAKGELPKFVLQSSRENPGNPQLKSYVQQLISDSIDYSGPPDEGAEVTDFKLSLDVQRLHDKVFGAPNNGGGMAGDVRRLKEKVDPIEKRLAEIDQNSRRNSAALDGLSEQMAELLKQFGSISDRLATNTTIVNPQPVGTTTPIVKVTPAMLWTIIASAIAFMFFLAYVQFALANGGA